MIGMGERDAPIQGAPQASTRPAQPGAIPTPSFWATLCQGPVLLTAATAAISAAIGGIVVQAWESFSDCTVILTSMVAVAAIACAVGAACLARSIQVRAARRRHTLASRLAARDVKQLAQGFQMPEASREMAPVVVAIDHLLRSAGASLAREKAFTSGAAHELRTPLGGMRATIEVALAGNHDQDTNEHRQALRTCLGIVEQMQRLVNNLLFLSRLDSGQVHLRRQSVDLPGLASELWSAHAARAADRNLRVAWDMAAMAPVSGDPDLLCLVLGNVLDNAVSHADAGGEISVVGRNDRMKAVVEVSNTGCVIGPDEAKLVFRRFWRGNAAERTDQHSGLGLALCQDVMTLLGGSIRVQPERGQCFSVRLELPLYAAGAGRS